MHEVSTFPLEGLAGLVELLIIFAWYRWIYGLLQEELFICVLTTLWDYYCPIDVPPWNNGVESFKVGLFEMFLVHS